MTPKEAYEARKADRAKLRDMDYQLRERTEATIIFDLMDRLVMAMERIATALETGAALTSTVREGE